MQLPFADPADGLLDITVINKVGRFTIIRNVKNLYDGSFVKIPQVQTFQGKKVRVESARKMYLEADGESLGHSPFTFEILPGSLKVIIGGLPG